MCNLATPSTSYRSLNAYWERSLMAQDTSYLVGWRWDLLRTCVLLSTVLHSVSRRRGGVALLVRKSLKKQQGNLFWSSKIILQHKLSYILICNHLCNFLLLIKSNCLPIKHMFLISIISLEILLTMIGGVPG
jgi:hypothetical protein